MKLIRKPESIQNVFGGVTIRDVMIWSPSDEAGRTFEKLRTGNDTVMRIGQYFECIEFASDGIVLYDVQAVESFNNDTYRCTVDKFAFDFKQEK